MRRIKSKESQAKRERINQVIVGLVLASILLVSTIGFALLSSDSINIRKEKKTYNGVEFVLNSQTGLWDFQSSGKTFSTYNTPYETEDINSDFISLDYFTGNVIYFVIDNPLAANEIVYNFNNYILRFQEVCLDKEECLDSSLVSKNCSSKVIVFKESEELSIKKEENCVFILAPYERQIEASDRIIFKALGIQ
jgi:hypothetical protein